jgi:fatty-acyl-CoA synthase
MLEDQVALARVDLATGKLVRGADGFCVSCAPDEPGELLGKVGLAGSMEYDGYTDREATERKLLRHVFEPGDAWFRTGDLLRRDRDGYYYFVDRIGDTFRWKGENVSTNEVAEILNGAPGVLESNVFGVRVPGAEGRAGMACLRCNGEFSLEKFTAYALERLPVYQRPYFLRLLGEEMRTTGTFKQLKVDYRREGYDPELVRDPLYFLDADRYVPLDAALHAALRAGRVALR